jgi:hypothetical protein
VKNRFAILATALAAMFVFAGAGVASAQSQASLASVRQATLKYKDIDAAFADGYVLFYTCTEQPGVGTMGQHLINFGYVGDDAVDALHPEGLVYEPKRNGGWKLVAVEYVTFQAGVSVLGQSMNTVPATNRYGIPSQFYAKHAWIWQGNPDGVFADWNPDVTCLGTGDNGG